MKNSLLLIKAFYGSFIFVIFLFGCEAVEPVKEDVPELITQVTLNFTPIGGGEPVKVTATDPDGDGVQDITVDGSIELQSMVSYELTISLINQLAEQSSPEYDITDEVQSEGDEHMFFYGWNTVVFSDPSGNGNIDNRNDLVNYRDEDETGLPIGIHTFWVAGTASSGTFRIILKHQPGLKSATSTVEMGETDLDVEFVINVN